MKIKDFMIKDVISVTEETTIQDLLETLVAHQIGGVPVVNKNNVLLGIISDGDVIRYLQPKGRTAYDMFALIIVDEKENFTQKIEYSMDHQVEEIMRTKNIQTVNPESNIEEALYIFSKFHFKKIPVVNDNKQVVGVVSRGDIIHFITTQLIK